MKVTFIQVNYGRLSKGTSIIMLRGIILREYPYSSKNVALLIEATGWRGLGWKSRMYDNRMTIQPE